MYEFLELFAVVASGIYGVLLARQHQMDFVGVFSLSLIVAFGGGTLRDLFLDRNPLFWIQESHYPVIIFWLSLFTAMLPRIPEIVERYLTFPDALGLGLFSVVGALAAIESGTSLFVASLMGVITGTFGGVIGDVVCNKVPSLFRSAPMYASCGFIGCWILFGLQWAGVPGMYSSPVSIAVIVLFRLAALRWDLRLPLFQSSDEQQLNSNEQESIP